MRSGLHYFAVSLLLVFMILGTAAQGEESSGTVLKIGTPNIVKSPSLVGDYYLGIFAHLSNPPLMKMTPDGKIEGLTAESYEVSDDGLTWTFKIRDGLRWSDGENVTSEDVKFTFDYLAKQDPNTAWMKDVVSEILVQDDSVVFKLKKPDSSLNLELATHNVLPKHIWEKVENATEKIDEGEIVGCGPFVISKTDLGAGIVYFKKNPYWTGTQPKIDAIELHTFSNMDVLSLALEKGEVDAYWKYAGTYPAANVQKLKDTGKFEIEEKPNVGFAILGINLKREPMSDIKFREALAYGINYDEILKLDAQGYGQVANRGFVPPSMAYFKETEPLKYDPDQARKILAEAGYKDSDGDGVLETPQGKAVKLTLLIQSSYQRMAELMVDYLKGLGMTAEIKTVDQSTWYTLKESFDYDLTLTRTTPWGMMVYANWGSAYFDSRRTGQGVLRTVDDPEYLKLCDQIMAATSKDQLEEYAHEMQDYYAKSLPAIPLYWGEVITPYNKDWTGWVSNPLYGIYNADNFLSVQKA
ncbi:MAG TPA: ABC transporter substrate-binding protein [Methanothrix sp.]|nr:ABC transporter substrate-binding protein [Methanothrix sp.]